MGYLKPCKGKLTSRKFSKVFLVPFNARCCLCRVLSGPFGGIYMWNETHCEKIVKIGCLFFQYFMGRELDGREITHILRKVWVSIFQVLTI